MTDRRVHAGRPLQQRGVALVVVLVLLLVVTLLALASLRNALLEERMSAAVQDRSLAFQAVEAALREGEAYAATRPAPTAGGCIAGLCSEPDPDVPGDNARWLAAGFWGDASGTWREATVDLGGVTARPRYIVELLETGLPASGECTTSIDVSPDASCFGTVNHYRITAYSQAEGRADVMIQSIYAVP